MDKELSSERIRDTEQKVFSYLGENGMIAPGDTVVLGVSGGADSVCLFFLLLEYRRQTAFEMRVVHVNHGIRADAGEDEAFVEKLCTQYSIPFHAVHEDVHALASAEKISEEDAGRRLRYRVFGEEAAAFEPSKIAVAHNADDRAETLLLHLFRGSGLRGLQGIEPVRGNIIRPILCIERAEVEAYLTARKITWCTDSTNATDDYTRNRVRHHILPFAEEQICDHIVAHLNRTADSICEAESYIRTEAAEARKQCVNGRTIDVSAFQKLPTVLQKRILLELAEENCPTGKDICAVHLEAALSLFEKEGNRTICLPYGLQFIRQYETVSLSVAGEDCEEQENNGELVLTDFPMPSDGKIPENRYTKWLDYDKIKEPLVLRFRQTGDYLSIADGNGGIIHKTLKDYMITEKIPRQQRDRIPVLAQGSHIVWLVGYRISEYFKVDENTKHILQVECKKCF